MSIFIAPLRRPALPKSVPQEVVAERESLHANDEEEQHSGTDETVTQEDEEEEEEHEDGDEPTNANVKQSGGTQGSRHRSQRYHHIDLLVTVLHKCMLDGDWIRAERAYGLLLRCKGVDIRLCYDLGLDILLHIDTTGTRGIEFLSRLIVAYPPLKQRTGIAKLDRADVFVGLLAELRIRHGQYRSAMQELEGWLLVPPYKDDLQLWSCLARVYKSLEEAAAEAEDMAEVKKLRYKRLKAEAKADGETLMTDDSEDE